MQENIRYSEVRESKDERRSRLTDGSTARSAKKDD